MKFKRYWNSRSMRELCIECQWYTHGTNAEYDKMLLFVDTHLPTDRNIEKVAYNILTHSGDGRDIETIAYCIANEVVKLALLE